MPGLQALCSITEPSPRATPWTSTGHSGPACRTAPSSPHLSSCRLPTRMASTSVTLAGWPTRLSGEPPGASRVGCLMGCSIDQHQAGVCVTLWPAQVGAGGMPRPTLHQAPDVLRWWRCLPAAVPGRSILGTNYIHIIILLQPKIFTLWPCTEKVCRPLKDHVGYQEISRKGAASNYQ